MEVQRMTGLLRAEVTQLHFWAATKHQDIAEVVESGERNP